MAVIIAGAKPAKNKKHSTMDGSHREVMAVQANLTSKENSDEIISVV